MEKSNIPRPKNVNFNQQVKKIRDELELKGGKINITDFVKYKKKKDGEVNEVEKLKRNLVIAGFVAIIVMLVEFYLLIIK